MVLWSRFWAHSGLDPRKNPNTDKKYNVKSPTVHYQSLASKDHLRIFWRQLPLNEKKKLIGTIGNIIKEVVKEDEDCFSYPQLLSFLFEISAKSQESNAEGSFIDFLYFSPLNRADTRLDFVVRRMGVLVQREYADKLSKDLLLGEQEENARKAEKKEKKRKQKKKQQKKGKEMKEQEKKKKQEEVTKFVGSILTEILDKVDSTVAERRRNNKKKVEVRRQLSASTSSIVENKSTDQYDDWIDVSTKPDRSVRFAGQKTKAKEAPETTKSSKKMAPDPKSKAKEAPPSIRISKKTAGKPQEIKQPVPTITAMNNNNTNTAIAVGNSNNNNNVPKEKDNSNIWKDIGKLIKSVASSGTASHNQSSASSPKEKDKEGREKDTVNRSRSDPHLDRAVVRSVKFGESTFASANHSPRQSVEINAAKVKELEADNTVPRASNKSARLSGNFTRSNAMNIEPSKKPQGGAPKQVQQEEQKYEVQYPPLGNTQKLQQLEEKLIAVQQEEERKQKREKKSIKRRQTSPSNYNQPKRPPSPPQHHPYHLIDFPSNYNYPFQSSSLNNNATPGLYFRPPIYAQAQSPPYAFKVITGSPPKTNTNKSSEKSSMSSSPTGGSYIMTMDGSGYYPPQGQGPYYYLPEQYQMHVYQQQTPLWPQPWAPFYPAAVNKLYALSEKDNQQMSTIHDQIIRFQTLVDEMVAAKAIHYQSTVDRVTSLINGRWPDVKVEVFGSLSTGLSIPSSDLDLVVHGITSEIIDDAHESLARSPDAAGSTPLSDPLKLVANMLRGQDWVKTDTLQCIETASVPVIKFHTADPGIHVDISFHANVTNHSGAEARELLKYYCGMYKELKPLVLVLKQFLYLRKLNNSYTGGLSSYCLVLMIVSFLQLYGSRAPAAADGSLKNLGVLLLDFLELYGLKFEFEKLAISIAIGGGHIPIEHCQPMVSAPLIILDPFNPQNNIGFNSFEMWKVRRAFSFAYNSATLQLNSLIQSLNQEDREDTVLVEQPKNFKVT
jgi:hypothetical protein